MYYQVNQKTKTKTTSGSTTARRKSSIHAKQQVAPTRNFVEENVNQFNQFSTQMLAPGKAEQTLLSQKASSKGKDRKHQKIAKGHALIKLRQNETAENKLGQ